MADRIIQMKDNQGNNLFPLVKISPSILEGNYLPITGGTLTGDLILKGDPTSLLMPATKQYVDNGFVKHRENGTSYTQMGTYYNQRDTAKYIRIGLPKTSSTWAMVSIECSIREYYNSGYFGKLYIYGNWSSSSEWNNFYAHCNSRLSTDIKVYGSDKRYIYIGGIKAWGGVTVDKITVGDDLSNFDISNIEVTGVSSLPTTYQTATMSYNISSENYSSYALPLSGGTLTGTLNGTLGNFTNFTCINDSSDASYNALAYFRHYSNNDWGIIIDCSTSYDYGLKVITREDSPYGIICTSRITGNKVYGAVWNDYAEYRKSDDDEPGRVVMEDKKGVLQRATERLQPFAGVVSDTFGFAIGETDEAKTPLAVAGRVLVYPYRPREEYNPGDCVCAAPDGTVDIMTRQEIRDWPDRIVGTVSEIPDYKTWGTGNVEVNDRIWIKVR